MHKLAIVVSHPIQYYAPLFKTLSNQIELKVFYCHNPSAKEIGREGFDKAFKWDIDLLRGYSYEFLENKSKSPSLSAFNGSDTPEIGSHISAYGATHVVVFGWYLKSFIQTRKYCNKNDIPIAARGDSQLDPLQIWYKRLLKTLYYPYFLKKFDAFLSVGNRNKRYLLSYGVPESQIIFSPHAIDQQFWAGEKQRNKHHVFIWVAKFISKKRPLDVIRAFNKVHQEMPNIELRLVGSGELLDKAKKEAQGNERIQFLGFKNQKELREEYLKADTLILSSDYEETWGLVVNEAYACGLNAIVSDACGCSDDLVNNQISTKYAFGNIDELARRMLEETNKEEKQLEMENQQIRKLNTTYSFNRNVESFLSFMKF